MIFTTRNSRYELKQAEEGFILKKLANNSGQPAFVGVGKEFRGDEVVFKEGRLLLLRNGGFIVRTSVVQSIDSV